MSNRRRTPADRVNRVPASLARSRPSATRAQVSRRSHGLLARLHAMPRWVVPAATVALVLAGMFSPPPVGGVCLLAVAAFLLWLAYLAWPQLSAGGRFSRLLVVALVAAVGVARMTGLWA
ncbi:MAG: hypothetical protein M3P83_02930 [Actinomycetota bacterium]|nr:hypothetical protein [Actinomycetota bacterium]